MLVIAVVGLILVLLLSAFFSGSETALMSLNRYRLRHLERESKSAVLVRSVVQHPEKVLGTILTGNVFVNTAAGALLTYLVTLATTSDARARAISVATVILTALILVFGEMVPKSLAARHPEGWSFAVIRPITLLIKALGPVVGLLTTISSGFLRMMGVPPKQLHAAIPLEELKAILFAGGAPEGEHGTRRQMLRKVIELGERRVGEVMVPRTEMVALDSSTSLQDIVDVVQRTGFSRFPIYKGSLDNIEGLVYAKDIITYWDTSSPFRLEQVLRKPYFLPDAAHVENALEQLQDQRIHMALVVDEHGGVEGLITLEDLLEEIVGELLDEKDEQAPQARTLPDGSLLLDGALSVKDANEEWSLDIPESSHYHTLAGFILNRLGHIPVAGEELSLGGTVFSVEKVAARRVLQVRARRTVGG